MTSEELNHNLESYGISTRTIQLWKKQRKIPYGKKVGRKRIYTLEEYENILNRLEVRYTIT